MGLVAARLRAGPIPTLRSLWHGPPLRRTQAARALRAPAGRKKRGSRHPAAVPAGPRSCAPPGRSPAARARFRRGRRVPAPTARAMGAGLPRSALAFRAPGGRKKRGMPHPAAVPAGPRSCAPPGRSPAARARSRRGRRVPAPTARAMGAQRPRASVSSAHLAQETRHVPPPRSLRRSNRPQQPSEVWRAAALQVKSYRPAPPGGRGVCAPGRKHSLHVSPAAPKAQGKRAPPGGKDRQRRAFPTPAVRRGFSDAPIAVCRSSPRCPR